MRPFHCPPKAGRGSHRTASAHLDPSQTPALPSPPSTTVTVCWGPHCPPLWWAVGSHPEWVWEASCAGYIAYNRRCVSLARFNLRGTQACKVGSSVRGVRPGGFSIWGPTCSHQSVPVSFASHPQQHSVSSDCFSLASAEHVTEHWCCHVFSIPREVGPLLYLPSIVPYPLVGSTGVRLHRSCYSCVFFLLGFWVVFLCPMWLHMSKSLPPCLVSFLWLSFGE